MKIESEQIKELEELVTSHSNGIDIAEIKEMAVNCYLLGLNYYEENSQIIIKPIIDENEKITDEVVAYLKSPLNFDKIGEYIKSYFQTGKTDSIISKLINHEVYSINSELPQHPLIRDVASISFYSGYIFSENNLSWDNNEDCFFKFRKYDKNYLVEELKSYANILPTYQEPLLCSEE